MAAGQDADVEGFQLSRHDRRRIIQSKRRDRVVIGMKNDARLKSGSGKIMIIVKYVHNQYECDDIRKYLSVLKNKWRTLRKCPYRFVDKFLYSRYYL